MKPSVGIQSLDDPRALQILATEHWSLLASRTMSWNEAFSRASMFLATLSAAVIASALVAQVSGFGQALVTFVLVILPFVELIGLATFARLGEANAEDVRYLQGMNRIRHAYLEAAPLLEPYFVSSHHDDLPAVFSTYGITPVAHYSIGRRRLHYAFVTTQGMVGIIDSMLAGVFGAQVAILAGASTAAAVAVGILAVAAAFGLHVLVGVSIYERLRAGMTSRFPTTPDSGTNSVPRWRASAERTV
ncbi:MAG TPA: hypothetical protein VJ506_03415 [Candidatus Limnocylindrales bacterium]|nr:hypothetical protein [Candidatus Limnocylindrales bacterium]